VVDGTKGTEALQKAADGFAASVSPMVREMRGNGLTLREIAEKLAADGIRTATGWPVDGNGRQERPGPGSVMAAAVLVNRAPVSTSWTALWQSGLAIRPIRH
jgi:hypothetical protein